MLSRLDLPSSVGVGIEMLRIFKITQLQPNHSSGHSASTVLSVRRSGAPCFCMGQDCLWDSKEQYRE